MHAVQIFFGFQSPRKPIHIALYLISHKAICSSCSYQHSFINPRQSPFHHKALNKATTISHQAHPTHHVSSQRLRRGKRENKIRLPASSTPPPYPNPLHHHPWSSEPQTTLSNPHNLGPSNTTHNPLSLQYSRYHSMCDRGCPCYIVCVPLGRRRRSSPWGSA